MFLTEPPATGADLHFRLFGIPIRVHPLFWLGAVVLGMNFPAQEIIIWVLAVFVGILIHELGHASVMRLYGFFPRITLYVFGGLATYGPSGARRQPGWLGQIFISAAGPLAGFLAAAAVVLAGWLWGAQIVLVRLFGPIMLPLVIFGTSRVPVVLVNNFLQVCLFWGLINLLPVLPLDGGHISNEVLTRINPHEGWHRALFVSMVTAGIVAVFALLRMHDNYLAIFFGFMAFSNFQALRLRSGGGSW